MLRAASSWQRCWRQCSTIMHTSGTTPHSRRLLQSIANTILDRFRSAQRGGTGHASAPSSWSKSVRSSSASETMMMAAGSAMRRFCHYGLIFTCNICEKRAGKAVSKIAYDKGLVVVVFRGAHEEESSREIDVSLDRAISLIWVAAGVVIVQCEGCGNRHLIADRLGWFGEPGRSVESAAHCNALVHNFLRY